MRHACHTFIDIVLPYNAALIFLVKALVLEEISAIHVFHTLCILELVDVVNVDCTLHNIKMLIC